MVDLKIKENFLTKHMENDIFLERNDLFDNKSSINKSKNSKQGI